MNPFGTICTGVRPKFLPTAFRMFMWAASAFAGFSPSTVPNRNTYHLIGCELKTWPKACPAVNGSHIFVDKETLMRLNPDVIFVDGGGLALVQEDYGKKTSYYQSLKAFSERKVFTLLPFNWYTTNVGTALADAFAIGKTLYPEAFADVDIKEKCNAIYSYLVGQPVYDQMEKDYAPIGKPVSFIQ